MDLTAQTLRDAQFRQAWKGYDTAEVDDFLDDIALGVDRLESRLRDALERATEAEQRAVRSETRPVVRSEPDESVRRTLVLAQRAADLVVTEAKSVADRIVADARDQAAAIINEATAGARSVEERAAVQAGVVVSEAEATAERMTTLRAAELQLELAGLIEDQARRRIELEQLTSHVEATRSRLRSQLQEHMDRLEHLQPSSNGVGNSMATGADGDGHTVITLSGPLVTDTEPSQPVAD